MKQATTAYLNALNRAFYQITGEEFDATRGEAWRGWHPISKLLVPPFSVLDVGCGNGRFGVFLAQKFSDPIFYHGIDNNAALLARARDKLATFPHVRVQLDERDIVDSPPDSGEYDLVSLFGVLHHVPGFAQRVRLIQACAARVKPNGLLAFACWRFYEYDRFRERIQPFPPEIRNDVEEGDYLLDWRRGASAVRYCHYANDDEIAALVHASGLAETAAYRADGFSGAVNAYRILQKPPSPSSRSS